jgi:RecA-family ATPase
MDANERLKATGSAIDPNATGTLMTPKAADTAPSVPQVASVLLGELKALDDAPPKRQWLLEIANTGKAGSHGVLPRGKCGMLSAGGGVGKTNALCQLALAVATGEFWLGAFKVPNPGNVYLALGEEDIEEVHRRMWNAAHAMQLSRELRDKAMDRIAVLPLCGMPIAILENAQFSQSMVETMFFEAFKKDINERFRDGVSLVVMDPLSRFAGLDTEKDNAAATKFVECVESLVKLKGRPTVLVAHHTSKGARGAAERENAIDAAINGTDLFSTDARGASGLVDGFRWVASLANIDKDTALFQVTKSNYGLRGEPVLLRRDSENGGALVKMNETEKAALVARHTKPKASKERERSPSVEKKHEKAPWDELP